MKRVLNLFIAVIISIPIFAQAPESMSYQAVVRNSSGDLVSSATIGMQISIIQSSATGASVYIETHTPSSNANGLVNIEIGTGTIVTGSFSGIDWADGPYFIKTETDPTGGTGYTISGTTQLLSVPYALYAESAGNDAYSTSVITRGALPIGANCPANGSYTAAGSTLAPGIYMYDLYSCDGQMGQSVSGFNITIEFLSGTGDASGTWHDFNIGSNGTCGKYYTGIVRVQTTSSVAVKYSSSSGSSFTVPSANAEGVTYSKIN